MNISHDESEEKKFTNNYNNSFNPENSKTEASQRSYNLNNIELWNPRQIFWWSFPLTPIFGSWFIYQNWKILGNTQKAEESFKWFIGSIIAFFLILILNSVSFLVIGYLAWYFYHWKDFSQYLKTNLNNNFHKKRIKWAWIVFVILYFKPLLTALLVIFIKLIY